MNFVNPYTEIYFSPEESRNKTAIPLHKEVIWALLKAMGGMLGMYRHRVTIKERDFNQVINL
ncbi:hypothetical protein ACD591_09955 [Rufibacter glacialis]|uniref:Uncharacterized protein n=1 Tax=Rufibacter glacialis TaxID=1259555 RepID=A0A5M8QAS4_9BACT|nr:hypothetical protein [Rufibacter glacialis]KAA6431906.1 hypothetical protein FOE74_17515 [Rufibacter glacialis]GGK80530.1 hypothetical protein GCM10011405_30370 [Rufibacter glacialis]